MLAVVAFFPGICLVSIFLIFKFDCCLLAGDWLWLFCPFLRGLKLGFGDENLFCEGAFLRFLLGVI